MNTSLRSSFQSICEKFGTWYDDENASYHCFTLLFLKTFLPLLSIFISIVYISLASLLKTKFQLSNYRRQYASLNPEENNLLNNSNPNYSTIKNKEVPKQIQNFLINLDTYNNTLCFLSKFQLVVTLILSSISLFTAQLEPILVISLVLWTFISLLCYSNRNLDFLIILRILFLIVTIIDIGYLRLVIITNGNSTQLYEKILSVISVIVDSILLIQSLLMQTSIAHLNDLAKQSTIYPSPEPHASILSILTFSWIQPLLAHGYNKIIEPADIWDLRPDEKTDYLSGQFEKLAKSLAFSTKIVLMFRYELFMQFIFSMTSLTFNFLTPVLLHQFLLLVESSPSADAPFKYISSLEFGFLLVLAMLFTVLFKSMCDSQSLFYGRRIGVRVKAIVLAQVYAKTLRRREQTGKDDINAGKITNFMSVDAHDIAETCCYLNYLYIIPVQLVVTAYYLYIIVGWPALVGIALTIVVMPLNYWVSVSWEKIQSDLMACSDKRMDLVNELLQGIRIIKFFAWENQFKNRISTSRTNELKVLMRRMIIWIVGATLWFCFPMLITFATFFTYTKIAGLTLTTSVTFTALIIFKQLREPVDLLPEIINMLLQAKVSLGRIDSFLVLDESKKYEAITKPTSSRDPTIGFRNATVGWGPDLFTLKNLDINFPTEQLSLVIGPTGSGKTSLLMALLGEMHLTKGSIYLPSKNQSLDANSLNGGIAYVAQSPWLQQDTIRNNILFGEPYDETRYKQTIECCALVPDFKNLQDGDLTEIGEKGITLSGGQKQRVAIARAVYSKAKHIVFDDPLSAVDAHTAKFLFKKCIMGKLLKHRTRILVTHNVALTFDKADYIVQLDTNGQVLLADTKDKFEHLPEFLSLKQELEESTEQMTSEPNNNLKRQDHDNHLPPNLESEAKATKLVLEEERAKGAVKFQVYRSYFDAAGGGWYWLGLLIAFLFYQIIPLFLDYWLKNWAQAGTPDTTLYNLTQLAPANLPATLYHFKKVVSSKLMILTGLPEKELDFFIQIYLVIMVLSVLSIIIRVSYQFWGSMKASRKLHDDLLENILRAPIRFFDTTPVGRLVNRFSKDLQSVDQELMSSAGVFLSEMLASTFILGMIVYIVPQFLIVGFIIAYIFWKITMYYMGGSRELKRIESTTRSPIYNQCGETILGVTTIRAFEHSTRFQQENFTRVDANIRCFFYLWVANRWLSIRSDLIGGLVTLTTGVILLALRNHLHPTFMGLAFTYALNFASHILWIARFYSIVEMNMNSIERIQEYLNVPSEPPAIIDTNRPPPNWPTHGKIEINDLVMRYAADRDPVINNISLTVQGGEKVGVVGRTGAGKSTLALALFRFIDPDRGSILIDDVSIHHIGLHDLRSNLTIIPQDAVLFTGTIRTNLDPFNKYEDSQLWKVLQQVHIIQDPNTTSTASQISGESNDNQNGKITSLEMPVTENGNNFSQGQRQLLSLARALLRQSKVIVMDEATASVDYETDAKIQTTIRESFDNCTLLCIAHRLRTIIDYDKVLVLDKGTVKEFDTPKNLLNDTESIFYDMCTKSGELDMLLEMANQKV